MSEQQLQKVKVKRLAHVGLWTTDIVAQTRFYRHVLGFDMRTAESNPEAEEESNVFLSLGDEYHCLGLFYDTRSTGVTNRRGVPRSHLHHLSFELDTDAELAALAARLKLSGIDLRLETRDGDSDLGETLWFSDPDGNQIEISVSLDDPLAITPVAGLSGRGRPRPTRLQHIALRTTRLEEMVEFYVDALGFDISDWLLRECAWLRCNNDHHTLILVQGRQEVDHLGFSVTQEGEILRWADTLSRQGQTILWGPGRHGAGNDLFLRLADPDGLHTELSADLQQYFDQNVSTPPRQWHSRSMALNMWGALPAWIREDSRS